MWPVGDAFGLAYAFGGIELVRNADGNGLRYADTAIRFEHPEVVESTGSTPRTRAPTSPRQTRSPSTTPTRTPRLP